MLEELIKHNLSQSERDIALLILSGKSHKEIAKYDFECIRPQIKQEEFGLFHPSVPLKVLRSERKRPLVLSEVQMRLGEQHNLVEIPKNTLRKNPLRYDRPNTQSDHS